MTKYRFKTEEEFKDDGLWIEQYDGHGTPQTWNHQGDMNHFMGQNIPDTFINRIESGKEFDYDNWTFRSNNCILNSTELSEEETKEILKQVTKSLIKEKKMNKAETKTRKANPVAEKFVFMDKTVNILNVGYSTCKNVILYGPGE